MASVTRVGLALRVLREGARLDQAELAAKAGISSRTITRIETGEGPPNFETVEALLAALGYTLHDLANALDEVNGRTPPAGAGLPDERRVAALVSKGRITGDLLSGWVLDAMADERALADLSATVGAAAQAILAAEVERVRSDLAVAGAEKGPLG